MCPRPPLTHEMPEDHSGLGDPLLRRRHLRDLQRQRAWQEERPHRNDEENERRRRNETYWLVEPLVEACLFLPLMIITCAGFYFMLLYFFLQFMDFVCRLGILYTNNP